MNHNFMKPLPPSNPLSRQTGQYNDLPKNSSKIQKWFHSSLIPCQDTYDQDLSQKWSNCLHFTYRKAMKIDGHPNHLQCPQISHNHLDDQIFDLMVDHLKLENIISICNYITQNCRHIKQSYTIKHMSSKLNRKVQTYK